MTARKTTSLGLGVAALLGCVVLLGVIATPCEAVVNIVVEFDPAWEPPPGVFSGGRAQATSAILSQIRSKYGWAGTTVQVGPTGGTNNITIKYVPTHASSYINSMGAKQFGTKWKPFTGGAAGLWDFFAAHPNTGWVFGCEDNFTEFNDSVKYPRAAGTIGAHEAGHGLGGTHVVDCVMKGTFTPADLANTVHEIDGPNRTRMLSNARAGNVVHVDWTVGKADITMVYANEFPEPLPEEVLKDPFCVKAYYELEHPDYEFGYVNDNGSFIPGLGGEILGAGGGVYDFAVRSRLDLTEVVTASDAGEITYLMPMPPDMAVIPVLSEEYFAQVQIMFMTSMGPVNAFLWADPNNGFIQAEAAGSIPTVSTWGMIALCVLVLAFGGYRLWQRKARLAA